MDADAVFVDTNVLVHANVASSPRHSAALARLDALSRQGARLWISRQVLREFLAVRSRPQTFSAAGDAREIAAHVRQLERIFRVAEDDANVTSKLLDLFEHVPSGGRQVHDANIVATMLVHGIPTLLTDNVKDFRRFVPQVTLRSLDT